jgi:hypothetical protein
MVQLVEPAVKQILVWKTDAYANFLQFGGLTVPPNSRITDDWFKSDAYAGSGKDVGSQTQQQRKSCNYVR